MERGTGGVLHNTTTTSRPGGGVLSPSYEGGGGINEGGNSALGNRPAKVGECDALDDTRQDDLRKRYLVLGGPPDHILGTYNFSPHPTTCHATFAIQD